MTHRYEFWMVVGGIAATALTCIPTLLVELHPLVAVVVGGVAGLVGMAAGGEYGIRREFGRQ